ncbi:CheY-like chemotaxis protein [Rubricella aquisinus]|uniref:CheY-like chemotaxis protein n=1 Tax=Rubricella aquisinus TaxID=2028108 RepID=A0A840WN17_9RHOB|nr:response regulator [Rubricella aquisinus]MBB5515052.1 CheY-like chemotaxis protein [Rubricella aquisinus]
MTQPALHGLHVLLVEDNTVNQMVAREMLVSLGARVMVANDGEEGLHCIDAMQSAQDAFDLVLLDIEMPRMSGLEMVRAIRSRGDGARHLPLIAVSAFSAAEYRAPIIDAGADGFIPKPIGARDAFGDRILTLMEQRRMREARTALNPEVYAGLVGAIGRTSMAILLSKVRDDILGVRAKLDVPASELSQTTIRAQTHILMSVSGAVGATGIQERASLLNKAAHGEDAADCALQTAEMMVEIAALLEFVERELAMLARLQAGGSA